MAGWQDYAAVVGLGGACRGGGVLICDELAAAGWACRLGWGLISFQGYPGVALGAKLGRCGHGLSLHG